MSIRRELRDDKLDVSHRIVFPRIPMSVWGHVAWRMHASFRINSGVCFAHDISRDLSP